jgi:hypothetical protein
MLCFCVYQLFQGRKKLEEAFQHGKHAIDDLVNVAVTNINLTLMSSL